MMKLAALVGIDVPEIGLVPIRDIQGLPDDIAELKGNAFIIKRFDRTVDGRRIHMEDFAQIFAVYPDRKYEHANHANIATVIAAEIGMNGIEDYIQRLVFNLLIGNGDMHLKNWSLIYPGGQKAALAPAYDYVSTIAYIADDKFALNLASEKVFTQISEHHFSWLAKKAKLSEKMVLRVVRDTIAGLSLGMADQRNGVLFGRAVFCVYRNGASSADYVPDGGWCFAWADRYRDGGALGGAAG